MTYCESIEYGSYFTLNVFKKLNIYILCSEDFTGCSKPSYSDGIVRIKYH